MPTPLAEGQENSFAPQMIFLWPPARGVGKQIIQLANVYKAQFLDLWGLPRGPKRAII